MLLIAFDIESDVSYFMNMNATNEKRVRTECFRCRMMFTDRIF